jgi:hypothetical protein
MELAAQGFAEGTPFQMHQAHSPPAAANRDLVPGSQLANNLAICAQNGCGLRIDDLYGNRRIQW